MSRPLDYARPGTRPARGWAALIGWVGFLCGVWAVAAFVILCVAGSWVVLDLYLALLGCGLPCALLAAAFGNRSWSATAGLMVNVIMAVVTIAVRCSS